MPCFIIDVSLVLCRNYQERLYQLKLLREENERTMAAYEVKS